eukprot:1187318-Prorocentrum_minimum.AAC.3
MGAPQVVLEPAGTGLLVDSGAGPISENKAEAVFVRFKRAEGNVPAGSLLRANCKVYFCQDEDVCLFQQVSFESRIFASPDASPNPEKSR